MKVKCFSNVDDFKTKEWPIEFVCDPVVGDYVRAKDGTLAKITGRYHIMEQNINYDYSIPRTPYIYYTPILEVYLSRI